ncbi:uncharacterized protein LOC142572551 [Dermacentor variabilis]|uniref:uncharacterized protein LOC142572551 n=1 Tax=Dermacentor variabilis TaxID=34621 RepID=UPI003F5CACE6
MATPTPKSRQSKITDTSKENQESHESAGVSLQHSKDVSESSKQSQARVVDSVPLSKQIQPAVVERRQSASKSSAGGRSGSVSEKSTSPRSVEKPEPAPRDKHQQDHTPSKLSAASNAAKDSQEEHHRTSEEATPTSRRSAGKPEKPIAAPRSQPERRSPEKPSSSATPDKMPTSAAYSELQQRPESSSDVAHARHSASGRTTSRELVPREQRTGTDRGPFSSTPIERSVTSEYEGFITETKAVSSKPETPSKHRESASSDTAKLPDMRKSSSASEPPSEEQFEAAPSNVTQKEEEQPARMPRWKQPLTRSPKDRSADAESKKTAPLPLSAKDINSFAYKTVRDRLPVILTKVIDTVFRDRMDIERVLGLEAREETKFVVARLAKLRNEMVTNKPMVRIEDDFEDADIWNSVLNEYTTKHGCEPRWFEAPWLYIETYFYRRIFEAFQLTTKLRDYDPFNKVKRDALYGSFSAVRALCDFLRRNTPRDATVETLQRTTYRLIEVSLWGNRCDLSLSCGADSSSQAGSLQQTERLRQYIISNHADKLLQHLCRLWERNFNGELIQLHCVLDNSGYELATDLALLDFLHETGYVATVTIHTKAIPWYVSDVMRRDLFWTLRELEDSDHIATQALGERCQRRIKDGVWYVMDDVFWTQSFDYAEMATRRPDLYKILQSADLILFKGDLNYRKLVGDLSWHPTVSFKKALRGFEPTFVCALRTLKADTLAGIDPAIVSVVAQRSPDWMVTGEYAVIQCAGVECKEEPSLLPTPSDESSPKKSSTGTSVHELGTSASAHAGVSVHRAQSTDVHQEARRSSSSAPEQASGTAVGATAAASSSTSQKPGQQSTAHSSPPDGAKKLSSTSCSVDQDAPQRSD